MPGGKTPGGGGLSRQSQCEPSGGIFVLPEEKCRKNTRPFTLFSHREVREAFEAQGFEVRRHPEFFWPMVLHRMIKNPKISRALEAPARLTGLTRLLGSPVVLEARRK